MMPPRVLASGPKTCGGNKHCRFHCKLLQEIPFNRKLLKKGNSFSGCYKQFIIQVICFTCSPFFSSVSLLKPPTSGIESYLSPDFF